MAKFPELPSDFDPQKIGFASANQVKCLAEELFTPFPTEGLSKELKGIKRARVLANLVGDPRLN